MHQDHKATFAVGLPGLRLKPSRRRRTTIQHRLVVGEDAHVGSLAKVPEQVVAVGAESEIRQRISLTLRHVFSVQADSFFISGRWACRVAEVSDVFAVGTECVIRTVDLERAVRTLRYTVQIDDRPIAVLDDVRIVRSIRVELRLEDLAGKRGEHLAIEHLRAPSPI